MQGRRIIQLFLFISLLNSWNILTAQEDSRGYIVEVGDKAPDFSIILDNGEIWTLSENRGKVIMLQFTASWCSVCRKEMPFIENEIWAIHRNDDFSLIGIDRDEPLETVLRFKKQTGVTYPLALDKNAEIFKLFAHEKAGVTRNVIIDKSGKIVFLTRLFNAQEFSDMKKVIYNLLEAPSN